jgi:NAD+ synthase (glutamine-hydrolysing)
MSELCGMKIALAQQNYLIGDFENNTKKIIAAVEEAKKENADLVMFTELCVCGYPPRDFVEFNDFINKCYAAIHEIKEHADYYCGARWLARAQPRDRRKRSL